MIERFYLKNYLSFKQIELNLNTGLIVFTGPSGSGKSILMNSILSSLGVSSCDASVCESSVNFNIDSDATGIENDDINVFKYIKKDKSRYFINNQGISKKSIKKISSQYLRHLNLKDYSDFDNVNLIHLLDQRIGSKHLAIKDSLIKLFLNYSLLNKELKVIEDEERRIEELKEFASFEISKINSIDPSLDEDEALLKIKRELSQKDKVIEVLSAAKEIFNQENLVSNALNLLDIECSSFDDAMYELKSIFETAEDKFTALDELDIEKILTRIEEISSLKKRYGGIQEALDYRDKKILELEKYENIDIEKKSLEEKISILHKSITDISLVLTKNRKKEVIFFEKDLNKYLKDLYLRDATVIISPCDLSNIGSDCIEICLNKTALNKISTGEFNRLRLAILALKSEFMDHNGGVLFLDEIDANLSGEESMSVAKVLKKLSSFFQIFVISHQPQLTSMGDQHFFIYKEGEESHIKELDSEGKVNEIARIISGENISTEAKGFARELLNN